MNAMNAKKVYIWRLAEFLAAHKMQMSGEELADHLNRNHFMTGYGTQYKGKRGTYTLIRETYTWLNDELGLPDDAGSVAVAYVKPDGSYAYK